MSDTKLDVGDGRFLTAVFTDDAGDAVITVDPADVHLTIKAPDGTETTHTGAELTVSGNEVRYSHTFTLPGRWHWVYEWSDGTNLPQAGEYSVVVRAPRVTRQNP